MDLRYTVFINLYVTQIWLPPNDRHILFNQDRLASINRNQSRYHRCGPKGKKECVSDYLENAYCDPTRSECTNEILSPVCHGITGRTIFHAYLLSSRERKIFWEISRKVFGAIHRIRKAFNPIVVSRLTLRLSNGSVPSKYAANRWLNVQDSSHSLGEMTDQGKFWSR